MAAALAGHVESLCRERAARDGLSARSSAAPIAPRCSAVATSAPAAPRVGERAQVGGVAHAAAREQRDVRAAARAASAISADVGALARADAGEVERRWPRRRAGVGERASASGAAQPGERRVGREHPAARGGRG